MLSPTSKGICIVFMSDSLVFLFIQYVFIIVVLLLYLILISCGYYCTSFHMFLHLYSLDIL